MNHVGVDVQDGKSNATAAAPALRAPIEQQANGNKANVPAHMTIEPMRPGQLQPTAICSTCDDGVDATTALEYYGHGQCV